MKLVKMIAIRGRIRSPFNQPVLFSVGPHATEVTKPAPPTAEDVRRSDFAIHVELETSTAAKVIRSVPRAVHDDYGYDGGARAAYQALYVPRNFNRDPITLPVQYSI